MSPLDRQWPVSCPAPGSPFAVCRGMRRTQLRNANGRATMDKHTLRILCIELRFAYARRRFTIAGGTLPEVEGE